MLAIYKRELRSAFKSMHGIIFMTVLLLFVGFCVFNYNLYSGYADISGAIYNSQIILLLIVPVLCMRSMAEDKHNKTDMFLLSLPLSTADIVIGKFLSLITVYLIPTAIISVYPLILAMYGDVNFPGSYTAILAFMLLGVALIALCQFLSSLTESQVIAAVLGVAGVGVLYFSSTLASFIPSDPIASLISFIVVGVIVGVITYFATRSIVFSAIFGGIIIIASLLGFLFLESSFEALFPNVIIMVSPFFCFDTMCDGYLDLAALCTLLSFTFFFVFLTYRSVDRKRLC